MKSNYTPTGKPKVSQSNALGIKKAKVFRIKKTDDRLTEAYLLLVRTELPSMVFFIHLLKTTNYLFTAYHLQNDNNMNKSSENKAVFSEFYATYFFDDLAFDWPYHFCFKNISFNGKNKLFGLDDTAKFRITEENIPTTNPTDLPNQTFLPFDFEEENQHEEHLFSKGNFEIEEWNDFIKEMKSHSISLQNNFNYVFPIEIFSYQALKPFFLHLHKLDILQYQMVKYDQVKNIETFAAILQEENQRTR